MRNVVSHRSEPSVISRSCTLTSILRIQPQSSSENGGCCACSRAAAYASASSSSGSRRIVTPTFSAVGAYTCSAGVSVCTLLNGSIPFGCSAFLTTTLPSAKTATNIAAVAAYRSILESLWFRFFSRRLFGSVEGRSGADVALEPAACFDPEQTDSSVRETACSKE